MRILFLLVLGSVLTTGCANQIVSTPPAVDRQNIAVQPNIASMPYALLYQFKARGDGAFPLSGLLVADGGLYGTTGGGGTEP